ncbi:MAG: glucose-1-phosphate adenylyltransferase [Gammaproteobacteria bacterium]|nr:glucose-1-phosphate adenylyltransferase [Gammaproteobacteria bacterium]
MKPRRSGRFVSRLTRSTMALIMAGGRGSRLKQLTLNRAKPATPIAGKFRIIDFPLSNCVNSGIRQILVLTQYKAHSLIQHVRRGWGFLRGEFGEFIEIVPAQQQIGEMWYRGTADCVYQNLDIIEDHNPEHVLILAGDHVYKMDYGPMIAYHVEKGADITVGVLRIPVSEASEFGVMTVDSEDRIVRFTEKPEKPEPTPDDPDAAMVSMGIYVFNRELMCEVLRNDAEDAQSVHDFGKNIIPGTINNRQVFAYTFTDVETRAQSYWRDVGNVDAYFDANMELVHVTPELDLYDDDWPIWTYQEQAPPAKFVLDEDGRRGVAINSMVAGGCIISGAVVRQSVLFSNVLVDEGSRLDAAVILPNVKIGKNCVIRKAVIDENCDIADGTTIGVDAEEDAKRFFITRKGVALVTEDMLQGQ